MAETIYVLCGLTSVACAVLLIRSYMRIKSRLLLLSSIFFITQAVTNILLYIDFVVIPATDLALLRAVVTIAGLVLLVYGLIWETT